MSDPKRERREALIERLKTIFPNARVTKGHDRLEPVDWVYAVVVRGRTTLEVVDYGPDKMDVCGWELDGRYQVQAGQPEVWGDYEDKLVDALVSAIIKLQRKIENRRWAVAVLLDDVEDSDE